MVMHRAIPIVKYGMKKKLFICYCESISVETVAATQPFYLLYVLVSSVHMKDHLRRPQTIYLLQSFQINLDSEYTMCILV